MYELSLTKDPPTYEAEIPTAAAHPVTPPRTLCRIEVGNSSTVKTLRFDIIPPAAALAKIVATEAPILRSASGKDKIG